MGAAKGRAVTASTSRCGPRSLLNMEPRSTLASYVPYLYRPFQPLAVANSALFILAIPQSSKPQGIPSEGFSYCFPPSDPHPLPSPASSLSGSFSSSSPSNLENLANFGSWRDLGLGGQHGHSSHGLNNNAQQSSAGFHPQQHQHAIQFSSHPFSGFGGQVQHYQHSSRAPQRYQQQQQQQQQPSGDDLREPTMDELREAVRIGMAHGASIAAAAGGERGGGAGGGGAWGYEHRQ
jgi:hypothetical protein